MFKRWRWQWRNRKLKYRVTVKAGNRVSYSPKKDVHILERPVRDWLFEQGPYYEAWNVATIVPDGERLTFLFRDRNTALLFKLTWGGV